jgi:coproporphyrinogen III oxidase-like Fe-S oxidoreductase
MKTILAEIDRMATQGHALEMGMEYRKGVLSQERIDALNALGFIWDTRVRE